MTASDHLRDIRDPASGSRAVRDNESWQRTDLGLGGRHAGREYYEHRGMAIEASSVDRVVTPGNAGRTLTKVGIGLALAGAAGWLWLILAFVSSVGRNNVPDDAFGTRLGGIPLGSGGLVAVILGILLAVTGIWLAKAARRRTYFS
jgi:hypothetical protein